MITNKNYVFDLANLSDKKTLFDFANEMIFDKNSVGIKSNRDSSPFRLLESPAKISSRSSNTRFVSFNPKKFCDRFTSLLQKKPAGHNFDLITEESIAVMNKLLQFKCNTIKQHLLLEFCCLN